MKVSSFEDLSKFRMAWTLRAPDSISYTCLIVDIICTYIYIYIHIDEGPSAFKGGT